MYDKTHFRSGKEVLKGTDLDHQTPVYDISVIQLNLSYQFKSFQNVFQGNSSFQTYFNKLHMH